VRLTRRQDHQYASKTLVRGRVLLQVAGLVCEDRINEVFIKD
jgi:hypothetical protein